jgi:hypothetical protein
VSMSSQGPGWWQASDGRWYPPEQHPSVAAPPSPPPVAPPTWTPPSAPVGPPTAPPASAPPAYGQPGTPTAPSASIPPAYGQPGPPPGFSSPTTRRSGPRWGLWIGLAVVVAVLFGGAVVWMLAATSEDRAADDPAVSVQSEAFQGDTSVYDLTVGDCFDDPTMLSDELVEVESVDSVDCDEPHGAEVYAVVELPQGDGAPFPGDTEVAKAADELCLAEFDGYVGAAYEDSALYYNYYLPIEESWAEGDRMVTCLLLDFDGAPLTGSMEDSGR